MDWESRIAELEQAERDAMAQFNYVAGRLEEARHLYAQSIADEPASLGEVGSADPTPLHSLDDHLYSTDDEG